MEQRQGEDGRAGWTYRTVYLDDEAALLGRLLALAPEEKAGLVTEAHGGAAGGSG
jgi:hypothetical protein